MGMFDAIDISTSGVTTYRTWLDALSDNIANINTVRPSNQPAFQEKFVVAQAVDYSGGTGVGNGVRVESIAHGSAQGRLVYDPTNPLADKGGYVRQPDIDLGSQMTQLIMAQRGYQANLAVVDRAHEAYTAALTLGKNS
jgi:flagellar basal-body rod protein FlgC